MIKQLSAIVVAVLLASTTFAQNSSTAKMPVIDNTPSLKGFRVSIVKPTLKMEFQASAQNFSGGDSSNLDSALGFSLGYVSLPVQSLGWTSNLTYLDIKDNGGTFGVIRADGNLAYALDKIVHVKGGLNLSKLTGFANSSDYNPAIGFQAGLGFQMTKNFGLDVGYTQMHQIAFSRGATVDLKETGLELGAVGTF